MSDHEPDPRPHRALIGLLLLLLFIACVVFVMHRLNEAVRLQDCFASGRTNCVQIAVPPR
jgi:hypothetical protein